MGFQETLLTRTPEELHIRAVKTRRKRTLGRDMRFSRVLGRKYAPPKGAWARRI
jgi:hypothetical protein